MASNRKVLRRGESHDARIEANRVKFFDVLVVVIEGQDDETLEI